MRAIIGYDYFQAKIGKKAPIEIDTKKLVNGHMFMIGGSGMGKSYTIRELINQIANDRSLNPEKIRIHLFDVHGDLEIEGASTVVFSEQSPYGLMPFKISSDLEFGGVRKCIQAFIRVIDQSSRTKLGLKQEKVLRSLLEDLFLDFGFDPKNPLTWSLNEFGDMTLLSSGNDNRLYLEVPLEEKDRAKTFGARWDPDKKKWWVPPSKYTGEMLKWKPAFKERTYPTVKDLADYANRIFKERFLGSDQKAVTALQYYNKKVKSHQTKMLEAIKRKEVTGYVDATDGEELDKSKQAVLEALEHYLDNIKTGQELDSLLKYQSPDTLSSVSDRISNLYATGLFKAKQAPFDPNASIWRYKLNALSKEEKKMFVLFTLQEIFNKSVQNGEQSDVVELIVLDELSTYTSTADEDGEGIIGVISREARKYGLALWAANQSLDGVPMSLVTSAGTKMILGLDETLWQTAISKLKMDLKLLEWISPTKSMTVQFKEKGALKNRWWWVTLGSK